jgi:hypothetical protein
MKTSPTIPRPVSVSICNSSASPYESRLGIIGRLTLALLCGSLLSLVASPTLSAAAPNGQYKFVSGSGRVNAMGESINLTKDVVKNFAVIKNGKITVKNNIIKINQNGAVKAVNEIGNMFGIEFQTTVSGPSFVQLAKSRNSYVGSTTTPVVVKFSAVVMDTEITGTVSSNVKVKVVGNKMTIDVPITGSALGYEIEGNVKLIGKK